MNFDLCIVLNLDRIRKPKKILLNTEKKNLNIKIHINTKMQLYFRLL